MEQKWNQFIGTALTLFHHPTTELKKALMQKLFTEGTRGEPQRETEIGLVPESWEVVNLIDVCEKPQYGFTDSAAKEGNAQFLRITDITEFGVNWNEVPFCNCPDFKNYELNHGDIVFARIGATTGKSYLRRASEFENMGLKALDALHLACAQKSAEIMLTTDDELIKTVRANNSLIKIRVENPVRWLMEITENES